MYNQELTTISEIITNLNKIYQHHPRSSKNYSLYEKLAKNFIKESNLAKGKSGEIVLTNFGKIIFPYKEMGAINTLDLFGLDELIIFSFYWQNKDNYKITADIGANLGLHSIFMNRCGWSVKAYEPDPKHLKIFKNNMHINNVNKVDIYESAVSDRSGKMKFTRVMGNTTSSHLTGAKDKPYGDLEYFDVEVIPIGEIMKEVDFIKMDVEGQEKAILTSTKEKQWLSTDMMVEIGSEQNSLDIFEHFKKMNVNLFTQKTGWKKAKNFNEMPKSYKEGSVFISTKSIMPWV